MMALDIKTVTTSTGGLHGRSCHQLCDVNASGLSCRRLVDFLPPWQSIGWDVVLQPGPGFWLSAFFRSCLVVVSVNVPQPVTLACGYQCPSNRVLPLSVCMTVFQPVALTSGYRRSSNRVLPLSRCMPVFQHVALAFGYQCSSNRRVTIVCVLACGTGLRPDMTFAADWALKKQSNYLSVALALWLSAFLQTVVFPLSMCLTVF